MKLIQFFVLIFLVLCAVQGIYSQGSEENVVEVDEVEVEEEEEEVEIFVEEDEGEEEEEDEGEGEEEEYEEEEEEEDEGDEEEEEDEEDEEEEDEDVEIEIEIEEEEEENLEDLEDDVFYHNENAGKKYEGCSNPRIVLMGNKGPTYLTKGEKEYKEKGYRIGGCDYEYADDLYSIEVSIPQEIRDGLRGRHEITYFLTHEEEPDVILDTATRVVIIDYNPCDDKPCKCQDKRTSNFWFAEEDKEICTCDIIEDVPYYSCNCNEDNHMEPDPIDSTQCVPIDYCKLNEVLDECEKVANQECILGYTVTRRGRITITNEKGYECKCIEGYERNIQTGECVPGCSTREHDCDPVTEICETSKESPKGYVCKCNTAKNYKYEPVLGKCILDEAPKIDIVDPKLRQPIFRQFEPFRYRVKSNKDGRIRVKIDPQFANDILECKTQTVSYIATDIDGLKGTAKDTVLFHYVDQCLLTPPTEEEIEDGKSPIDYSHKCVKFSYCDSSRHRNPDNKIGCYAEDPELDPLKVKHYDCLCPPQYVPDDTGYGCIDKRPPIFRPVKKIKKQPIMLSKCKVCGVDVDSSHSALDLVNNYNSFDDRVTAFDALPPAHANQIDPAPGTYETQVEAKVEFKGVTEINDRYEELAESHTSEILCYARNYEASDESGNISTFQIDFCVQIEDVSEIIEEFKQWKSQSRDYFIIIYVIVAAVVFFLIGRFGSYFLSFFLVHFVYTNPSWNDFSKAKTVDYYIFHPFADQAVVRQYVHREWSKLHDNIDDFDDDLSDDE